MNKLRLESLISFDLSSEGQTEDKFPFVALITYGGRPSDGFVGGTETIPGGPYRVIIPPLLLAKKLDELVGKSVFAAPDLASHSNSVVVGEFLQAWDEQVLLEDGHATAAKASGLFTRKEHVDLVDQIVFNARQGLMGFSWDIKDVKSNQVVLGGETVLELTDFKWRGATTLMKEAAAYRLTQLAASKEQQEEELDMTKDELKELAASAGKVASKEVLESLKADGEILKPITEAIEKVSEETKSIGEKVDGFEARLGKLENPDGGDQQQDQDPPAQPQRVNVKELATSIASAVVEGLKERDESFIEAIGEKLEGLKASSSDEGDGTQRKTQSGVQISDLHAKYLDDDQEDLKGTVEGVQIAIDQIKAQKDKMPKGARMKALETLSAEKRRLIKDQQRYGGRVH